MARGGVNKAVVQTARLAILARGEHPSIDAVRIEMGNTGSKTTIHRYLKELDDGEQRLGAPQEQIDDELTGLVTRLAQRLKEQAQEPIDRAEAAFEAQKKLIETQLAETLNAKAQLTQQLETSNAALAHETATLQSTRSMLQTEQTLNAGLNQALIDFELRLKDKDEQIRSLEEKHLHARDALEHYRSAIKEQREQEQRRHEGQLQQVQMELRQAQQSALVRQDEITQLHRDNERLLTENRGTLRELSLIQEHLKQINNRHQQLLEHSNRVDSERTLLQERLRVALLESQSLQHAVDEQARINQALELSLTTTEAALQALHQACVTITEPDAEPVKED